jgi:hypothetical protein
MKKAYELRKVFLKIKVYILANTANTVHKHGIQFEIFIFNNAETNEKDGTSFFVKKIVHCTFLNVFFATKNLKICRL